MSFSSRFRTLSPQAQLQVPDNFHCKYRGVLCPYFPAVGPALSAAGPAPMGGTERGGAIRRVPCHPRLRSDGDMESGAYGAANAGGSFDLRRFVSQPQVVTRLVSMVSRLERTRNRASGYQGPWAAGRGARQVAAAARPGPGGERRAPRPSGSLCSLQHMRPVSFSTAWLRTLSPQLGAGPHRTLDHSSGPLWCGTSGRCSGEAGLSPCWQWEGPERGTPQQVAGTPRLPA